MAKLCTDCKWCAKAPAGLYCVNPDLRSNKRKMRVDGKIDGYGSFTNACEIARLSFVECGAWAWLFEPKPKEASTIN